MSDVPAGRVVTVGNAMVDVIAFVPRQPQRGSDVLADRGRLEVGGGGFRAVAAARAAGAAAVYGGRVGTGPLGDLVRAALAGLDVASPLPPVADRDTGFVLTTVEPDGERTFATVPGAESAASGLEDLDVRAGDVVHVHGYGLVHRERAERVVAGLEALDEEVPVLVDPGPFGAGADPAALARLLRLTHWWSGNAAEARAATGLADPAAAVRLLAATVRRGAVVRQGAAGCLLALSGRAPVLVPAPHVAAVDTTGAGDTHVGTFLAALLRGAEPIEAAREANAAAARLVAAPR